MQLVSRMMLVLSLTACGTTEARTLELSGPPKVTVHALGPVKAPPTALLSDGSVPEGAEVSVTPDGVIQLSDGQVTAEGPGEATVSTTWNGQSVSWTLVVSPPVQLSLGGVPATLAVDQTVVLKLAAVVAGKPTDATGAAWSSSKPEVLEVSPTGEVRGVSAGLAYVVVKVGQSETMAEIQVVATE